MRTSTKQFRALRIAAGYATLITGTTVAAQNGSSLSVPQVDIAMAMDVAKQPLLNPQDKENITQSADVLANIINRLAAGETLDEALLSRASALSSAPTTNNDGNSVFIQQQGLRNQALVTQNGQRNDASIVQDGNRNESVIEQNGDNNNVEHLQIGNNLAMEVTQNGDSTIIITQTPN